MKTIKGLVKGAIGKSKDVVGTSKSPEELKAQINLELRKLEQKKNMLEGQAIGAEREAKNCLAVGDGTKADAAMIRMDTLTSSLEQINGAITYRLKTLNAIEIGITAGDMVKMNKELNELMQCSALTIQPEKIEEAAIASQTTLQQIENAGEQLTASMKACTTSQSSDRLDDIRTRLMAEIEAEGGTVLSEKERMNV